MADWLALSPASLARISTNDAFADVSLDHFLFLDTETTGLGGGALAFEVGVGFFADDAFVIRQYFLRDPAEESAMLLCWPISSAQIGRWSLSTVSLSTFRC